MSRLCLLLMLLSAGCANPSFWQGVAKGMSQNPAPMPQSNPVVDELQRQERDRIHREYCEQSRVSL
jgi:hypothetical protein